SQVFKYLPADMPELARKAFRGTRFQLSAFIFGGAMKYVARVPRKTPDGKPIYRKEEGPYFESIKGAITTENCEWDEEAGGLWY
ncbi:hypothetical protein NL511_30195, partial [Klebsiella pneumoniae]|nr:hypothetical protein [Klebsiella pneumoniae]